MTYEPIDAADWIAGQPGNVREAGESRARMLIDDVRLLDVCEAVERTQIQFAAAVGTTRTRRN